MEIVTIIMAVLGIIAIREPLSNWLSRFYQKHQWKKFSSQENLYHLVVTRYFRYYNRLNATDRQKFLFRTFMFHNSKKNSGIFPKWQDQFFNQCNRVKKICLENMPPLIITSSGLWRLKYFLKIR